MDAGTMRSVIMNLQDKLRELQEAERLRQITDEDLTQRTLDALQC